MYSTNILNRIVCFFRGHQWIDFIKLHGYRLQYWDEFHGKHGGFRNAYDVECKRCGAVTMGDPYNADRPFMG